MKLEDKLQQHYEDEGISSIKFICKHWKDCKGCDNDRKVTEAKAALIGRNYQTKNTLRLLFVSLDPREAEKSSPNPSQRTVQGVRESYEETPQWDSEKDLRKHWYQTHNLAWFLLKSFSKEIVSVE